MLNQIRDMINQNSRRRTILNQLGDIERRLFDATTKSRQLSLKRYIKNLSHMKHSEYGQKADDMPDCTICLIMFAPEDKIMAFQCDPKHYFHSKCGQEWLEVKTECPLCRRDFTEEINKEIAESEDIISDVARQAVDEGADGENRERISQEHAQLNELVRELTASLGELH